MDENCRPINYEDCEDKEMYKANIKVHDKVLNTVNPLIFGENIEWTNFGMGLFLPNEKSCDERIVEEFKTVGFTHLRYPGGTLSDYFHWYKAVGEKRENIFNFFSNDYQYPDFGPDEFMELCNRLNIPGTITLNAGTGTPNEVADWVKYYADKGFDVTNYTIGNEIYMHKDPEPVKNPQQYSEYYKKCRVAIKDAVPGTKLGAIGLYDTGGIKLNCYEDWMQTVLGSIGGEIDFIDVHNGYAPVIRAIDGYPDSNNELPDDVFASCFIGASEYVRDNIEVTKNLIRDYAPGNGENVEIHISEYGPLVYSIRPHKQEQDISWNTTLVASLYQATLFNTFLREPKITCGNHMPLLQGGYSALLGIEQSTREIWRNIIFYVFQMYTKLSMRQVLDCKVDSPVYSAPATGIVGELRDVQYIDAGIYRTRDKKVQSIIIVNRHLNKAASVSIDMGRDNYTIDDITTIGDESYMAANSIETPDRVLPKTRKMDVRMGKKIFNAVIPKHSLMLINISL